MKITITNITGTRTHQEIGINSGNRKIQINRSNPEL